MIIDVSVSSLPATFHSFNINFITIFYIGLFDTLTLNLNINHLSLTSN